MSLLSRTKEISKLRGLSLDTVATKAGLSSKSIYNWDRNSPKSENLDKVADVLNVSVDYLLGRTNEMHPSSSDTPAPDISTDGVFFFDGQEVDEDTMNYIRETLRRIQKNNN